ncbi:D-tagatose-bisphosphate aldolase, class II, non-catalytic subunit [Pokkaliibacter plantistimulans]|uniref:D-tagatose-bisphosphate aldolase, class II, non-catalytic subunit n=1 Tax=Proteobacteria bacterium 228 TaxID=2083153 RepID=A0A2S5KVD5_9PROT|nr:D-tagatose-bisphosphate aldolase, class II, non-catalytic subunit [Pokkaliibacter plantistimulans]PPC78730.1 D-tagatose-bisphosphate aldolase, class II, non-catalytic subunit [Pokkaliibacter plantistimulans]
MTANPLQDIAQWQSGTGPAGIPSICTAHPLAIEGAMRAVQPFTDLPLLIEATCNQVNQDGGYTGMTPQQFCTFVQHIALQAGFPVDRLIFGGDHLGPNPWKHLPAAQAMDKAEAMIQAYAAAGFSKLHLDCSMGCAGEPLALDDEVIASRAARLARAAEQSLPAGGQLPVYIIGTEVPVPGGALEALEELAVTTPEAAIRTHEIHKSAFLAEGLADAFSRVIGLVVQPGVEFGNHNVIDYQPADAVQLSQTLARMPGMVFEAHSTDYQNETALKSLVMDGFAILKVGPGLTFKMREALYGLDAIARELYPRTYATSLQAAMEGVMLYSPNNWERYYEGDDEERKIQRHFSYSDRIRYYWPDQGAQTAVSKLLGILGEDELPETLISQYLGELYPGVRNGKIIPRAKELVLAAVEKLTHSYIEAAYARH